MKSNYKIILVVTALIIISAQLSYGQISTGQIREYLSLHASALGINEGDFVELDIYNQHHSPQEGLSFVYLRQEINGIPIYNSSASFVQKGDKLILTGDRLIRDIYNHSILSNIAIKADSAIQIAAEKLYGEEMCELINSSGVNYLAAGQISKDEIIPELVFIADSNEIQLCWNFEINSVNGDHWWDVCVDVSNGELKDVHDWVQKCHKGGEIHNHTSQYTSTLNSCSAPPSQVSSSGYKVLALPIESPSFGSASVVVNPSDPISSPFGWHDIDGVSGADHTKTRGNNVYAWEDLDGQNGVGYSPDGSSSLLFDFEYESNQEPDSSIDASVTNLFYMNNMIHDIWYHYGFDEAAGNFQKNNYNNGGADEDHVIADALDGSWMNNAIFITPPDGQNPRMEMYGWEQKVEEFLTVLSPAHFAGSYIGYESKFGGSVPLEPINAELTLMLDSLGNPIDGCQEPFNLLDINGKIAVIADGSCQYTDKVLNAQNAGALAVIVVNSIGNPMFSMGGMDPAITIPSILIDHSIGNLLISMLENNEQITVELGSNDVTEDGSYDNVIIAHEYGHGISNRLTGGSLNVGCLQNQEHMGEGWSDWFGLIVTIEPGDTGEDARSLGTYVAGESPSGAGVRPAPYSTDFMINDYTYGSTNDYTNLSAPYGTGFVWATILWDMTWALIDAYGYDSNLHSGTGGNNIAMQLVLTGLKLQPCSPGFVDGRDAILQADELLYNGAHKCLLWNVFANRGLGMSADQGSSNSRFDQVEAFDLPSQYNSTPSIEVVEACDSYYWPESGTTYSESGSYTIALTNSTGCDSIVTLDLTITNLDINVEIINPGTIQVENNTSEEEINYSWFDCNLQEIIYGATGELFTPTSGGEFSVIGSLNNCLDTSECIAISSLGLENLQTHQINLYPNPTKGNLRIDLDKKYDQVTIEVTTMLGQAVMKREFNNCEEISLNIDGANGQYFVSVILPDNGRIIRKVILDK